VFFVKELQHMDDKQNILVVDDNENNLILVSFILQSMGNNNIIEAQYGELAIQKAIDTIPDLILLDIMLPDISGFEVFETLKNNERTKYIPVIFLSAKTDKADIAKSFALGAADYITKPINEVELKARVGIHLELKKSKDTLIESEKKYRGLFNGIPIGLYRTQQNGQIIDANPALVKMLGYSKLETLLKMDVKDTFVDVAKRNKELDELKSSGVVINYPFQLYRKDGTIISVTDSARIINDKNGKLLYIEGSLIDVTKQKEAKQALIENERRYRAYTETMQDVIAIVSVDGKLRYISPSVTEFGGYIPTEEIGNEIFKYFAKKSELEYVLNKLQKVVLENEKGFLELLYQPKNRLAFPIELTYTSLPEKDKTSNVLIVMRNISERKKAEQRIRMLSLAVEQSAIIMVITDLEGKIKYTNPAFTKTTGYTQEEVIGENPRILNAGTQAKSYYTKMWKKISSGKVWVGEFHNKKKNGDLFWDKATITPLKDENGNISEYLAVKEDITVQKEHQKKLDLYQSQLEILFSEKATQLESSIGKFKNIFESSSDAIVITDLNGVFLEFNQIALKRVGLAEEDITKQNILKLHDSKGAKSLENYFSDVIKHGQQVFSTHFIINGEIVHVELNGTLIKHNGIDAIMHVSRDITQRKAEEKLRLNTIIETEEKERKRFAKDLHDGLGATLSAAKMYMNIVKRSKPGSEKAINMLNESIMLIDEAGKEAKKIAVNIRPHDLSHFGLAVSLQNFCDRLDALGSIKVSLKASNFKVRLDKDVELNLFRTINELINNTFKYADAKNIKIELCEIRKKVMMKYSDDGKGFDYEKVMSAKKTGTGLDNIIFRARLLGGTAKITSKDGKGMSVKILIDINKNKEL